MVVPYSDVMPWGGEGVPGDVEPAVARKQLVGKLPRSEEFHELVEHPWVFGLDVGSLAQQVLRVLDSANHTVHDFIPVAGIDDNRACDQPCRLQQLMTPVGQVCHHLHRRNVVWIITKLQELLQHEVR